MGLGKIRVIGVFRGPVSSIPKLIWESGALF
jgi:hypothetical protein